MITVKCGFCGTVIKRLLVKEDLMVKGICGGCTLALEREIADLLRVGDHTIIIVEDRR